MRLGTWFTQLDLAVRKNLAWNNNYCLSTPFGTTRRRNIKKANSVLASSDPTGEEWSTIRVIYLSIMEWSLSLALDVE